MKVAVVTPYLNEPESTLERCHNSVLAQHHPATHFLVSDGGQRAPASWRGEHIHLPEPHRDGGCTPRFLGAVSAFNQGYDAVAFLDADNWYSADHIDRCVAARRATGAHVVFASRHIVLADGQSCPFEDIDVARRHHVDTSCYFIAADAAYLLSVWAFVGPNLWPACDRLFFSTVMRRQTPHAWTDMRTVYYTSRWGLHYKAVGRPPPDDEHVIDWRCVLQQADRAPLLESLGCAPLADLIGNVHAIGTIETENDEAFWTRLEPVMASKPREPAPAAGLW